MSTVYLVHLSLHLALASVYLTQLSGIARYTFDIGICMLLLHTNLALSCTDNGIVLLSAETLQHNLH